MLSAKRAKRTKLSSDTDVPDDNGTESDRLHTEDDADEVTNSFFSDLESVLSIQIILDKILRFLSYKDVHKLSLSCRVIRELLAVEFERRRSGCGSKYLLYGLDNRAIAPFLHHPRDETKADVFDIKIAQQAMNEVVEQLYFRPKIALILTGNVVRHEYQTWSTFFKQRLPSDCTIVNIQSKTAICGTINDRVYEVHCQKDGHRGLACLLLGAQRGRRRVHVFKSLEELVTLTDGGATVDEPVKCILYFSRSPSRAKLSKILSVCKERNDNHSIAFGGLVIDSLASFEDDKYLSKIECAGLVINGSEVAAASTIIEDMTDDKIRDSMIRFRDSIPFDITDSTKNTICFILSCIEHSPHVNYSPEYTVSESDIFHTIFPCNVRAFGFSGHGEFGQISGISEDQKKVAYQFSCVLVVVQFPMR